MQIEDVVALFSKLDKMVSDMGEMKQSLGEMKGTLESLSGNGQPGRVGKLEIDSKAHAEQINRGRGALYVLSGLLGLLGGGFIWHVIVSIVK